jgi:putative nucleotidyltransferase with HDIG domain
MDKELKIFEDYYSQFDSNNPRIKHKYEHTFRVVSQMKEIASSLNLDEKEYNRALVCALFHDLGRFPQAKEYDTFVDSESFDHGDKGYEILKELNYNDDIVLKAVKYHNKKEIPKFDDLTDMHCKLVRDADKVDIMLYFINDPIDNNYVIDDETIEKFKKHELLNNDRAKNSFVSGIRYLAFIFDINYKKTIEILLRNNVLENKIKILKSDINSEQIDLIEKILKEYIKERFDIIC